MSMWLRIRTRIIRLLNKLLDGSWQQILRRVIIITAVVALVIVGAFNIRIEKNDDSKELITQQEAKDKTDIKIVPQTSGTNEVDNKKEDNLKQDNDVKSIEATKKPANISENSTNDGKDSTYISKGEDKEDTSDKQNQSNHNSIGSPKPSLTTKPKEEISGEKKDSVATKKPITTKKARSTRKPNTANKSDSADKDKIVCKIEIRCDLVSDNIELVKNREVRKYIPSNGVILATTTLSINKGCSVYDVLSAITGEKGIQFDAVYSRINKSAYIKGINHLYEKDAGGDSGWVYLVNGVKPSVGCAGYEVKNNDVIRWSYSVNGYGKDVE